METLKILVTDDDPDMRAAVERILRGFTMLLPDVSDEVSFNVEQAASGEEALERVAAAPPDILILDNKLPGMGGMETLERLAPWRSEMLMIMVTAFASLETAVAATKRGAYDVLAKPFTPEELKTALRKAANRLILSRHARQLADEKRKVRFQFISVLAHELKAPIAAIEGYLRIMREHTSGDDISAYDQIVDRSLVRLDGMRKLIIDLLDMTRIESGEKQRELGPVDVTETARMVIDANLSEAAPRNIAIGLHAGAPVTMTADAGEIEIILNNLVSNAVKYNRDNGRVDVGIEADANRVTITVRDTGIGMAKEETAQIFNDFVRIKNAKTRHILGSGLGLSIVKKLAQLYGGDVVVESVPDAGTIFTVTLDRAPEK